MKVPEIRWYIDVIKVLFFTMMTIKPQLNTKKSRDVTCWHTLIVEAPVVEAAVGGWCDVR